MNTIILYVAAVLSLTPTQLDLELQACYPPYKVALDRYEEACSYRNWLQAVKDAGVAWPGWQDDYDRANNLFIFHDLLTDAMSTVSYYDLRERTEKLVRARAIAVEMGYPANAWLPATPWR